ncbi:unnamed protein product [Prunus brigantina]
MRPRCFLQRPWCLLKSMVGGILTKVAGRILAKVAECFLLKRLCWAMLIYLGRPLLLQKAGPGQIFSLHTLAPSSQHLGKQSWVKGIEVRREIFPPGELKFGGRYVH